MMNKIVAYIRSRLQPYYTAEEVSALSRIVCCDLLGQAPTDYYLGKDIVLSSKKNRNWRTFCNVCPDLNLCNTSKAVLCSLEESFGSLLVCSSRALKQKNWWS